jgi:hypothetical protein
MGVWKDRWRVHRWGLVVSMVGWLVGWLVGYEV